ncbi:MAG: hypothetical protein M0026_21780 [Nocardiopsaceae bacterium]|nr:hypothetical protein [Nocardiopsaceae bacterium]
METKAKAAAAKLAMARGAALGGLFPAPLEFRLADTARVGPERDDQAEGAYTASATYVCAVERGTAGRVLEALHTAWRARGWGSALRRLSDGGGDVTARDPSDGFAYTVLIRRDSTSLALWVETPPYRDPDPGSRFRPVRPG